MKKSLLLVLLLVIGVALVGCGKKEEEPAQEEPKAEWKASYEATGLTIPKAAKKAFASATKKYTGMTLEPIALLGTQVVSGTNYMFLCKGTTATEEPVTSYQIVTVYNSLKNKASVKEVKEFDFSKYVDKDVEPTNEELAGGWTVYGKTPAATLEEAVKAAYDKAFEGYTGFEYTPIALLGSDGTNYAVLVLGKSATEEVYYTINVVTFGEKLGHIAYVDLADFNE